MRQVICIKNDKKKFENKLSEDSLEVRVSCLSEYDYYTIWQQQHLVLDIKIESTQPESLDHMPPANQRLGIDLICVIDKSGSMRMNRKFEYLI